MAYYFYEIPDLSTAPTYEKQYNIGNADLTFVFVNNYRSGDICLSIYYINDNNEKTYIAKNILLCSGIILSNYITDTRWVGNLILYDNTGLWRKPTPDNVSSEYILIYNDGS